MGQLQQGAGLVPRGEEARQASLDDDGVAHYQVLGRLADAGGGPGHGHELDGAVEFAGAEAHPGLALVVQPQDAGVEGQQVLGGRRAFQTHQSTVAAGAHHPGGTLHAVDKLAVKVADLHAQAALAEVPGVRVRGREAGEVEDADVHCCQGHEGLCTGGQAGHRQLQLQGLPGRHRAGGRDFHPQLTLTRIHRRPGQADGAAGHALGDQVHGPVEQGGDIGPGPPVGGDGDLHRRPAGGDLDLLESQQPVAQGQDQGGAGEAGLEVRPGLFPHPIARLIQRDLEEVRGVDVLGRQVPAGLEGQAGGDERLRATADTDA